MSADQHRAEEWLKRIANPGTLPTEKVEQALTKKPPLSEAERHQQRTGGSGKGPHRLIDEVGSTDEVQMGRNKRGKKS